MFNKKVYAILAICFLVFSLFASFINFNVSAQEITTVESSPELNAGFTINYGVETSYVTPETFEVYIPVGTITVDDTLIVSGGSTYIFDHWEVDSVDVGSELTLTITWGDAPATYVIVYVDTATLNTISVASSPEINTGFTINGASYNSPNTVYVADGTYVFSCDEYHISGSQGYQFNHWLIDGATSNNTRTITLDISAATSLVAYYSLVAGTGTLTGLYQFYGPFSEETGLVLSENVNVTVHYAAAGTPNYVFNLNGLATFTPNETVLYFNYNFTDGSTRQYWVDPTENVLAYYVFKPEPPTVYVINFMDYTGTLKTYPYVEAKATVNGSLFTIEKRKVDAQNSFSMTLINGNKYQLSIGNQYSRTVYGDLLMTSTTGVQLVLRGVDFPRQTLLMYQYVHAYAVRDFTDPTGSITVSYGDITNKTTSVTITVALKDGTTVFSSVFTGAGNQTFSYVVLNLDNSLGYQVTVTVVHETFGDMYFKQYLIGEYEKASDPFDLSFLGSIGISTAWVIPALLIIFVAGCFSEISSEAAAVITTLIAVVLAAMGWISIGSGALITALSFSVMACIVLVRRRFQ